MSFGGAPGRTIFFDDGTHKLRCGRARGQCNAWVYCAAEEQCFSYDIHDLDFNGYFAISASSGNPGVAYPVYNTVNSFKIYDPKVVSTSSG